MPDASSTPRERRVCPSLRAADYSLARRLTWGPPALRASDAWPSAVRASSYVITADGTAIARKPASAKITHDTTRADRLANPALVIPASPSALRQDPVDELLQVRVRHVVGRHVDRAPCAASARLDLRRELRVRRSVAGVLLRDIVVRGTDQLGVLGVARLAAVFRGERGAFGVGGERHDRLQSGDDGRRGEEGAQVESFHGCLLAM